MSYAASAGIIPPVSELEERTYRKVTWRIIPFLFICYLAAYLDRVNVGFAKLQMLQELGFSETVYGLGASMFFVGYVLFEVPSNIVMLRVGARLWIARIMITWGLISGGMIFVHSPWMFYLMRFLLGVAEAGFIPGILLYLTYWFPSSRRGKITALFLAAIPMATIIGGPLSGFILQAVSGARGLSGWQWLFVIETIPSLLLGVATIIYLRDRVVDVKWLDPVEKEIVARAIAAEEGEKTGHTHLGAAFSDGRVWLLSLIYFTIVCGIYIISFWLPSLIKQAGVADPLTIGFLTAVPYLVAIVAMITVNISGDRLRERRWHTLLPALVCGLGLAMTAFAGTNLLLAMLGLTLAAAGASTAQAAFWCLPSTFLGGAAAAAGIALINSVGNIAGFVSNFFVGWMTDLTGTSQSALYLFGAIVVVGALLILSVPARLVNK
jgi:D-galactonate transporter